MISAIDEERARLNAEHDNIIESNLPKTADFNLVINVEIEKKKTESVWVAEIDEEDDLASIVTWNLNLSILKEISMRKSFLKVFKIFKIPF